MTSPPKPAMNDVTAGCFGESYREARTSCWSFPPFIAPPYEVLVSTTPTALNLERTSTIFSVGQGRTKRSFTIPVSYTHLRAHETRHDLVCRLLLEKKK